MTAENWLSFIIGVFVGVVACFLVHRMAFRQVFGDVKRLERESERQRRENDPANWWKYGRDPFEESVYDSDEENGSV